MTSCLRLASFKRLKWCSTPLIMHQDKPSYVPGYCFWNQIIGFEVSIKELRPNFEKYSAPVQTSELAPWHIQRLGKPSFFVSTKILFQHFVFSEKKPENCQLIPQWNIAMLHIKWGQVDAFIFYKLNDSSVWTVFRVYPTIVSQGPKILLR